MINAKMAGSKLVEVNFSGVDMTGADMQFADLTGVIYDTSTSWNSNQWYYTICPDGTNSGESRDCF